MASATFGLTALMLAVPYAYDALRFAGALYLLWLAWQTVRPGGRSPFQVKDLPVDGPRKLFFMGFFTSLLNPKIAVMYVSLLPQFIDPANGNVLLQSFTLGLIQVFVSGAVNAIYIFTAGALAAFMLSRPSVVVVQRWIMGTLLAVIAVKMATEARS